MSRPTPYRLNVRCTTEDRDRWAAAAEQERRTLSDWIRIVLDDRADQMSRAVRRRARGRVGTGEPA
jgi:predicted HicB family RNase H-like nuclease